MNATTAWIERDPTGGESSAPYSLRTHMLCWKPATGEVKIIAHPANGLAQGWHTPTPSHFEQGVFAFRQALLFVEIWHIALRDGVPLQALHIALLDVAEYRDAMSDQLLWQVPVAETPAGRVER